jgi:hypothetical protein
MYQPDPAALVAATAEEIVSAIAERAQVLAVFRRWMLSALEDIGLLDIIGRDFVRIGVDGLDFGDLEFRRADRLLRALQDLGRLRAAGTPACDGQQGLWAKAGERR